MSQASVGKFIAIVLKLLRLSDANAIQTTSAHTTITNISTMAEEALEGAASLTEDQMQQQEAQAEGEASAFAQALAELQRENDAANKVCLVDRKRVNRSLSHPKTYTYTMQQPFQFNYHHLVRAMSHFGTVRGFIKSLSYLAFIERLPLLPLLTYSTDQHIELTSLQTLTQSHQRHLHPLHRSLDHSRSSAARHTSGSSHHGGCAKEVNSNPICNGRSDKHLKRSWEDLFSKTISLFTLVQYLLSSHICKNTHAPSPLHQYCHVAHNTCRRIAWKFPCLRRHWWPASRSCCLDLGARNEQQQIRIRTNVWVHIDRRAYLLLHSIMQHSCLTLDRPELVFPGHCMVSKRHATGVGPSVCLQGFPPCGFRPVNSSTKVRFWLILDLILDCYLLYECEYYFSWDDCLYSPRYFFFTGFNWIYSHTQYLDYTQSRKLQKLGARNHLYFERQVGTNCQIHALNNLCGRKWITYAGIHDLVGDLCLEGTNFDALSNAVGYCADGLSEHLINIFLEKHNMELVEVHERIQLPIHAHMQTMHFPRFLTDLATRHRCQGCYCKIMHTPLQFATKQDAGTCWTLIYKILLPSQKVGSTQPLLVACRHPLRCLN